MSDDRNVLITSYATHTQKDLFFFLLQVIRSCHACSQ